MRKRYLFLTLNIFSATGGIEKVCRVAGKALHEIGQEEEHEVMIYSMYDGNARVDESYFPASCFKGFGSRRIRFILSALKQHKSQVVVLSHINLLPVGFLIKKLSPKTKLVLMAHGIEVWDKLSGMKSRMLPSVDLFLPVSSYTARKLQIQHSIPSGKISVLNNCLDPFLEKETSPAIQTKLSEKYRLEKGEMVLLTVTRLKHSEQYKGYDKVIASLPAVKNKIPDVKYLIVGKYDQEEKARLDELISKHDLQDTVIFTGFVSDEELCAHFALADVYIMPSTGEGFGIVFIEALFFGLPVIAGNQDGSVDALGNGEFGLLVNPNEQSEVTEAIFQMAENKQHYIPSHRKVIERFGFETYKNNFQKIIGVRKGMMVSEDCGTMDCVNIKI